MHVYFSRQIFPFATLTRSSVFEVSMFPPASSLTELWAHWPSARPQELLQGGQRQASDPCCEQIPSGSLHLPAQSADQQPALQRQQSHPSPSQRWTLTCFCCFVVVVFKPHYFTINQNHVPALPSAGGKGATHQVRLTTRSTIYCGADDKIDGVTFALWYLTDNIQTFILKISFAFWPSLVSESDCLQ